MAVNAFFIGQQLGAMILGLPDLTVQTGSKRGDFFALLLAHFVRLGQKFISNRGSIVAIELV